MDKRVVLFLILSLAIIFGYDYLMKELGVIPKEPPVTEEDQRGIADEPTGPQSTETPLVEENQGQPDLALSETEPTVVGKNIEEIETPLFSAQVSNRGAEILGWQLKKYLTNDGEEPKPIELMYPEGHFPGPLALRTSDPDITTRLQEGLYEVSRDFDVLDDRHPEGHLTFRYQAPEIGLHVEKVLTFHADSYVVDVSVKTQGLSEPLEVLLGTNFGVVEWGQGFIGLLGPAWKIGEVLEKESPENEIHRTGDIQWAALQDKYFISVIIPEGADGVMAKTEAEHVVTAAVQFPQSSQARHSFTLQLYAGPKQFDTLKAFQLDLEDTIDFGWFIYGSWEVVKAVAKPLFYVLRFLYDYTQNYGVAIILLTVGIKLLFVPLQYKSYKSMQGMQKIQPKVAALQAKFKDDREKLNKELIKLYREHKVNPVGGCLPMLLQMPAFISLFNILYMTVDLRQAPFMLWITDLSVQDPYYVLPVLMGASMVVQQKIMPTTMDPTQAKMMLMLPVVLTFLFVTFPAGLVLYWLTNNVLTIAQQFITDRYIFKRATFSQPKEGPERPEKELNPEGQETKKKKGPGKGSPKDS